MTDLRIATRQSELALWQANHVKQQILQRFPQLKIELVKITTEGDRLLDVRLDKIGGKGLFVKELETALLEKRADLAVHSMKDMPVHMPENLSIPVILEREDPRDALVSIDFKSLEDLPKAARIGTSSLRRQSQLKHFRQDFDIRLLRGNVLTRLSKLDKGEYDAIILAAAGLIRLNCHSRIRQWLSPTRCLPAAGQGAIGIECRSNDSRTISLIADLHHPPTAEAVLAERAMNQRLAEELPSATSICQVPIASYGFWQDEQFTLTARVASPDGARLLEKQMTVERAALHSIGKMLANCLLDAGALEVLTA